MLSTLTPLTHSQLKLTHLCIHIQTRPFILIHSHTCTHTNTHSHYFHTLPPFSHLLILTHMHVLSHTYTHSHRLIRKHTYTLTHNHFSRIDAYIHIRSHTHTYSHLHGHIPILMHIHIQPPQSLPALNGLGSVYVIN